MKEEEKEDKWRKWLAMQNKDEIALWYKATDFEEKYFGDMNLDDFEEELSGKETWIGGKWVKVKRDFYTEFGITLGRWRFIIVKKPKGYAGKCFPKSCTIKIAEEYKDNDIVLLHEMIHAFECMLFKHEFFFQYVLIKLYKKLSEQVPNLDELLMFDQHVDSIVHSPLFCLKSIDLDLRLNQEIGTTYAYEREELFRPDNGEEGNFDTLDLDKMKVLMAKKYFGEK
ncbi:hypothetical protein Dthio_PD3588 [Desulfonatronospira thiodismutans ASO3-1]|uniref:SprT-like domain-containing protein n=1 Tax=Desulfonatronospira thiodismutans ASO3-1 TaxID=555779 RepID=D6SJT2_9BACT|nr:hypothetical protein [Desulfonatronospira thiodismutans]EFI36135.1 hypothetical protein Dthio_PD3588 [Desulfonatronospira thiodismutans ASO3-1]